MTNEQQSCEAYRLWFRDAKYTPIKYSLTEDSFIAGAEWQATRDTAPEIAGGYAVVCPTNGTVFCIGYESAQKVVQLFGGKSSIRNVDISIKGGRWCSNLLPIDTAPMGEDVLREALQDIVTAEYHPGGFCSKERIRGAKEMMDVCKEIASNALTAGGIPNHCSDSVPGTCSTGVGEQNSCESSDAKPGDDVLLMLRRVVAELEQVTVLVSSFIDEPGLRNKVADEANALLAATPSRCEVPEDSLVQAAYTAYIWDNNFNLHYKMRTVVRAIQSMQRRPVAKE